ncbi:unnamed protein product [Rotaria socialis]|uniref:Uncharacterized protein n=1 Tax=Rotaria socialis TaxID=392032 RepID=A0A818WDX4_9BILA|nr:unnamed protein product [Rotaria socialis]
MEWPRKKESFLNILRTRLRSLSSTRIKARKTYPSLDSHAHIRIPIIFNKINVTQASTQTVSININNNAEELKSNIVVRHKNRRRKYQRSEINLSLWSKFLESREDSLKLNTTLEDLDQRLKRLSMNICVKCKDKDFC